MLDQCTETIIREVSQLKKMVNEFSQIDKLPESEPVPGDLNAVIREVAQSCLGGLPDDIRIELDLAEVGVEGGVEGEVRRHAVLHVGAGARVHGTVVMQGASVGAGATVIDSIVGPGADVDAGASVGPDAVIVAGPASE